jgi:hypothetical protein
MPLLLLDRYTLAYGLNYSAVSRQVVTWQLLGREETR